MLSNTVSNNDPTHARFSIELIFKLSISDNNWIISNDNQHIIHFLHSKETFKGLVINDKQHGFLL